MTAMPNDDLSVREMANLIADTRKRMRIFGITEDVVVRPSSYEEEVLVDILFMNVYRVLEEANSLTFQTKSAYPDIPWDLVRGMRNRLAHDYSHIDRLIVWETVRDGFPLLETMARDYLASRGLVGEPPEKDAGGDAMP